MSEKKVASAPLENICWKVHTHKDAIHVHELLPVVTECVGGERERQRWEGEREEETGREERREGVRKGERKRGGRVSYLVSQWGQFQASANEKRGEDIGNSKLQLKALQFGQLNPIKKSWDSSVFLPLWLRGKENLCGFHKENILWPEGLKFYKISCKWKLFDRHPESPWRTL